MNESIRPQPNQIYWRTLALVSVLNLLAVLFTWGTSAGWLPVTFGGLLTVYVLLLPGTVLAATSISLAPSPPLDFIFSLCGFMGGTAVVVHTALRQIRASGFVISAPRARGGAKTDAETRNL